MTKSQQLEALAKKLGYKVIHTTEADHARSFEREEEAFQEAERKLVVVNEITVGGK